MLRFTRIITYGIKDYKKKNFNNFGVLVCLSRDEIEINTMERYALNGKSGDGKQSISSRNYNEKVNRNPDVLHVQNAWQKKKDIVVPTVNVRMRSQDLYILKD